ncbi:hypothetical protein GCM10007859_24600 [Brevundimonas denitrificans]|uniref:Uncharacterized protein n=1 Tax=Brevundimonas denitrificans TaxID=1443434 RepID=A0ABQ6BKJ9_9CAUL|nr:hypothetical protein [Brevundimonas denitrificans]GLS02436.1 hypothetical protein GCM10007859_24600 [Brevundimonas denitrificans]
MPSIAPAAAAAGDPECTLPPEPIQLIAAMAKADAERDWNDLKSGMWVRD